MPDNMASDEQWDAYGENLRVDESRGRQRVTLGELTTK
jgi:hypothetical protein